MNKKTLVEILDTKRPPNLQDETLQSLRLAFGKFEDNGFKTVYDSNKIIDPVTKTEFATIEDLKNFLFKFDIPKDIPNKYFGILIEHWYENTTPEQNYSEPTLTKTTLDKDESAQLIAEADARNKQKADIKKVSDKAVQDALKQKQKLIDQRLEQELENKKIKVAPTQEIHQGKLTEADVKQIFDLSKAAKEDPAAVVEAISSRVFVSIATAPAEYRETVTDPIVKKSVTSLVEKLEALPVYESVTDIPKIFPAFNTVSPLTAFMILNDAKLKGLIHDDEIRAYFVERVQALALTMEAERTVNTAVANVIGSENFTEFFYGYSEPTNFEIADDQNSENSMEVSLDDVYKNGKDAYEYLNKLRTVKNVSEVTSVGTSSYTPYAYLNSPAVTAKTVSLATKALPAVGAVYGFKQGVLLSQWARLNTPLLTARVGTNLLTAGGIKSTVLMSNGLSSKILFSKNFATGYSVQIMQFAKGTNTLYTAGATFGNKAFGVALGKSAGKISGAGTIAVKASGQVVAKVLPSAIASKIGAFLGSFGGWVGTAVGFVVGELFGKLLEKVNWAKVKKFVSEYVLPVAVGGGLVMFGAPVAGLVAGGLLFGVARGATLASITAGAFGVLGFIGSSIGIAIATPVIITILVIPPLVAFIMLVINNSAYVVPPSISTTGADNPYMLVTKTANPSKTTNPTNNKTTVAYTVEIRALKSPLTNLRLVGAECNVIKKNNAKINCPPEDIPEFPDDLSISPTSAYSFTFFVNYDSGYSDALVFDTITIAADTIEESNIVTEGSASVCFGECPQNCAKVSNDADDWPTGLEENATIALGIISKYQGLTSKLCPNNETVNLCFSKSQIKQGYYAWHAAGSGVPKSCDIFFNEKGVGDPSDASFIITHELIHHVQEINGRETTKYESSGGFSELAGNGFCTYKDTAGSKTEAMAEAAALYVNSTPSWDACAGNYSSKYPKNFSWAQKFMTQ